MATYVKGDAVANATSYELYEKVGTAYNLKATASEINFNLDNLNFEEGDHVLVVKAKADGYEDSDYSNEVTYTVESTPGQDVTLEPERTATGFFINSSSIFYSESTSSVVVYKVTPGKTYDMSVERKEGAAKGNANLIYAPVTAADNLSVNNTPKWATGYDARVVILSENEQNVLNQQFVAPGDCNYILMSNAYSGSTFTIIEKA